MTEVGRGGAAELGRWGWAMKETSNRTETRVEDEPDMG